MNTAHSPFSTGLPLRRSWCVRTERTRRAAVRAAGEDEGAGISALLPASSTRCYPPHVFISPQTGVMIECGDWLTLLARSGFWFHSEPMLSSCHHSAIGLSKASTSTGQSEALLPTAYQGGFLSVESAAARQQQQRAAATPGAPVYTDSMTSCSTSAPVKKLPKTGSTPAPLIL